MDNKNNVFNFGNCAFEKTDKIIVCKERRSKFILRNQPEKKIIKVYVDDPKDEKIKCKGLDFDGRKCDCLIIEKQKNIAYFIELKGSHVNDAIKQLLNSIKIISNPANSFIKKSFDEINAYIVTSKAPKNVDIVKAKKEFKKKNSTLDIQNNKIEKTI